MSDIIIYRCDIDDGRWPSVEETGRFIVTVRSDTGGKEWHVIDRIGKPVDYVNGKGTIFSEDTSSPDGEWLLEGDSEPGFCVMMQAERYGETARLCVEHGRLLRKWEHIIPSLADYEWSDDHGWTAKHKETA